MKCTNMQKGSIQSMALARARTKCHKALPQPKRKCDSNMKLIHHKASLECHQPRYNKFNNKFNHARITIFHSINSIHSNSNINPTNNINRNNSIHHNINNSFNISILNNFNNASSNLSSFKSMD